MCRVSGTRAPPFRCRCLTSRTPSPPPLVIFGFGRTRYRRGRPYRELRSRSHVGRYPSWRHLQRLAADAWRVFGADLATQSCRSCRSQGTRRLGAAHPGCCVSRLCRCCLRLRHQEAVGIPPRRRLTAGKSRRGSGECRLWNRTAGSRRHPHCGAAPVVFVLPNRETVLSERRTIHWIATDSHESVTRRHHTGPGLV